MGIANKTNKTKVCQNSFHERLETDQVIPDLFRNKNTLGMEHTTNQTFSNKF
jgi:hypothetical protein